MHFISSCHVGELPLNIHESAVELLLLAHKFIAMVRTANEPIKSVLVRHLFRELEGVRQDDVLRLTKVWMISCDELCNKTDRIIWYYTIIPVTQIINCSVL